jgi:hypothetical protein
MDSTVQQYQAGQRVRGHIGTACKALTCACLQSTAHVYTPHLCAVLPRRYNWHRPAIPRELMSHLVSSGTTLAAGGAGQLRRLPTYLLTQLTRAGQLLRRRLGVVSGSSTAAGCSSTSGTTGGGWGPDGPQLELGALAGVDVESGLAAIECIICMAPVPLEPHSARVVSVTCVIYTIPW